MATGSVEYKQTVRRQLGKEIAERGLSIQSERQAQHYRQGSNPQWKK
jgi:hypothetical protein